MSYTLIVLMAFAVAATAAVACAPSASDEPTCYSWDGDGNCLSNTPDEPARATRSRPTPTRPAEERRASNPTATPTATPSARVAVKPSPTQEPTALPERTAVADSASERGEPMETESPESASVPGEASGTPTASAETQADIPVVPDENGVVQLTDPQGNFNVGAANYSPDGTRIAFASNGSIYTVNTDGTALTQIVDSEDRSNSESPQWSLDGTMIAFSSDEDGTRDVYVVRTDGTELTQMTYTQGDDDAWEPQWSPDGTRIAFTSRLNGTSHVYTINADGTGLAQITHAIEGGEAWIPQWSPDGSRVAFTSGGWIHLVNSDGSGLTNINNQDIGARELQWSPDGSRILFMSDADGTQDLYIVNLDGLELSNIVPLQLAQLTFTDSGANSWDPQWSPDGEWIAFTSDRDGTQDIYAVKPDGTQLTQITHTEGDAGAYDPEWSPDSTRLAFTSNINAYNGNQRDLYIANVEMLGDNPVNYTPTPEPVAVPTPTPEAATNEHDDRSVLVALYESTNGARWLNNANWLSNAPLNQWHGVIANPQGRVIALILSQNRLAGRITERLGELTELNALDLSANALYGGIPESIGRLQNLNVLRIGQNDLSGCVPATIRNVTLNDIPETNLEYCDAVAPPVQNFQTTQLTGSNNEGFLPEWSPDGAKIVFSSPQQNGVDLLVMDRDGSNLRLIANLTDAMHNAAWSPDSTMIAFDSGFQIYTMNADGSNLARITQSARNFAPAWSPDGTRIAYSSDRDGNWDIFVMNPDGSDAEKITRSTANDRLPAWSPDGTTIAFDSDRNGGDWDIYTIRADGSNVTRITHNPAQDSSATWAPDGTKLAFHSDSGSAGNHIYIADSDGADIISVTGGNVYASDPDWSPDGTLIAFTSNTDGTRDIAVANVDSLGILTAFNILSPAPTPTPVPTPTPTPTPIRYTSGSPESDRAALSELYRTTNGARWNRNRNWLSNLPLFDWYGVSVDNQGRVVGLDLKQNQLDGHLPDSISDLTALRSLQLAENDLTGCVPESLRQVPVSDIIFTPLHYCDEPPKRIPASPPFIEWAIGSAVTDSEERAARLGVQWLREYAQQQNWPMTNEPVAIRISDTSTLRVTCIRELIKTSPDLILKCNELDEPRIRGIATNDAIYVKSADEHSFALLLTTADTTIRENIHASFQLQVGGWTNDPAPEWFTQGMATYYAALIVGQNAPDHVYSPLRRTIHTPWFAEQRSNWAVLAENVANPLASQETESADDCASECGALAIELLASIASWEAIPYFYDALHRNISASNNAAQTNAWHAPFQATFGITYQDFYDQFNQHRAAGFPELTRAP